MNLALRDFPFNGRRLKRTNRPKMNRSHHPHLQFIINFLFHKFLLLLAISAFFLCACLEYEQPQSSSDSFVRFALSPSFVADRTDMVAPFASMNRCLLSFNSFFFMRGASAAVGWTKEITFADCGGYKCEVALHCSGTNRPSTSGQTFCTSQGAEWYFTSVMNSAVLNFFVNSPEREVLVGGSDDSYPAQTAGYTEGNFSWRYGRNRGKIFSTGGNPPVIPAGAYAPWTGSNPDNYRGAEHCLLINQNGFIDVRCDEAKPCFGCERVQCAESDCVTANTLSMDGTGSYHPNCACKCKEGYHGRSCERKNPIIVVGEGRRKAFVIEYTLACNRTVFPWSASQEKCEDLGDGWSMGTIYNRASYDAIRAMSSENMALGAQIGSATGESGIFRWLYGRQAGKIFGFKNGTCAHETTNKDCFWANGRPQAALSTANVLSFWMPDMIGKSVTDGAPTGNFRCTLCERSPCLSPSRVRNGLYGPGATGYPASKHFPDAACVINVSTTATLAVSQSATRSFSLSTTHTHSFSRRSLSLSSSATFSATTTNSATTTTSWSLTLSLTPSFGSDSISISRPRAKTPTLIVKTPPLTSTISFVESASISSSATNSHRVTASNTLPNSRTLTLPQTISATQSHLTSSGTATFDQTFTYAASGSESISESKGRLSLLPLGGSFSPTQSLTALTFSPTAPTAAGSNTLTFVETRTVSLAPSNSLTSTHMTSEVTDTTSVSKSLVVTNTCDGISEEINNNTCALVVPAMWLHAALQEKAAAMGKAPQLADASLKSVVKLMSIKQFIYDPMSLLLPAGSGSGSTGTMVTTVANSGGASSSTSSLPRVRDEIALAASFTAIGRRDCTHFSLPFAAWGGGKSGASFTLLFVANASNAGINPWGVVRPTLESDSGSSNSGGDASSSDSSSSSSSLSSLPPFVVVDAKGDAGNNTVLVTLQYTGRDTLSAAPPFRLQFDQRVMRCPSGAGMFFVFSPESLPKSPVGAIAEVLQQVAATISIVMAMPAVAAQMGMLSGLQDLVRCEPANLLEDLDFMNSPSGLNFGSPWGGPQRGVFAGTVIIAAGFTAIICLLAFIRFLIAKERGPRPGKPWPPQFSRQLQAIGVPGVYLMVAAFLMDSTVTAGVAMTLFGEFIEDRIIGCAFALAGYAYVASILWTTSRADLHVHEVEDGENEDGGDAKNKKSKKGEKADDGSSSNNNNTNNKNKAPPDGDVLIVNASKGVKKQRSVTASSAAAAAAAATANDNHTRSVADLLLDRGFDVDFTFESSDFTHRHVSGDTKAPAIANCPPPPTHPPSQRSDSASLFSISNSDDEGRIGAQQGAAAPPSAAVDRRPSAADRANDDDDDDADEKREEGQSRPAKELAVNQQKKESVYNCLSRWFTPLIEFGGDDVFISRYGAYVADLKRVKCFRGIELFAVCVVSTLQAAAYGDQISCIVQLCIAMVVLAVLLLIVLLMRPMSVLFDFTCTSICLFCQVVTAGLMVANMFLVDPMLETASLIFIMVGTLFTLAQAVVAMVMLVMASVSRIRKDFKGWVSEYNKFMEKRRGTNRSQSTVNNLADLELHESVTSRQDGGFEDDLELGEMSEDTPLSQTPPPPPLPPVLEVVEGEDDFVGAIRLRGADGGGDGRLSSATMKDDDVVRHIKGVIDHVETVATNVGMGLQKHPLLQQGGRAKRLRFQDTTNQNDNDVDGGGGVAVLLGEEYCRELGIGQRALRKGSRGGKSSGGERSERRLSKSGSCCSDAGTNDGSRQI